MEEEIIRLFDSNIVFSSELLGNMYFTDQYNQVNIGEVISSINELSESLYKISAKRLVTIESVVDELADFQKAIIDKTKFLNSKKAGKSHEAETYIHSLNDVANRLVKKAKGSLYKPQFQDFYAEVEALVKKQDNAFNIKKRDGRYTDKAKHRNTDEKLAATLFYIPLFEHKKAQILSNDIDVPNLASTLFYTLTRALDDKHCRKALEKLSKFQASIANQKLGIEYNFPRADGSYRILDWFNRISNNMKEDAKKIIGMSYDMESRA